MKRILEADLAHVLTNTKNIWDPVKNKSIFITGATGFFGKWLLETFLYINEKLELNASICALSRNPNKFLKEFPFYIQEQSISFIKGDIQDFEFPKGEFQYIIHAATDADAKLNAENPLLMLDTITNGTRHILNFAKQQSQLSSFLLTSSGAIYGKQPSNITHTKETDSFFIDINDSKNAYTEGKRIAELYCAIYNRQYGIPVKIARCFAFVGPYLPLDKHFAIGNFILNGLKNEDIIIKGDGTPFRSYLYAADLTISLWTILLNGKINESYNVGSSLSINIEDTAKAVASSFNNQINYQIQGEKTGKPVERYVPDTLKAYNELGLKEYIDIHLAIEKTKLFYSNY